MKKTSIVAITYFHILYAIARTEKYKTLTRLYVCTDYLQIPPELLTRLEDSNFFEEVVFFSEIEIRDELFSIIQKEGNPKSIFDEKLISPYESIFRKIEKNEEILLFNIKQLYYYYFYNKFSNVIIIEDGYKSLIQQQELHVFRNRYTLLNRHVGNEFPNLSLEDEKIKWIFTSLTKTEISKSPLSNIIKQKIKHESYSELFFKLNSLQKQKIVTIFKFEPFDIMENSLIILTQPLNQFSYCQTIEQGLLYKNIVAANLEHKNKIYIKPHPKDNVDYSFLVHSSDLIVILPKEIPVDLFVLNNGEFELGVTFGSTALALMSNVKRKEILFDVKYQKKNKIEKKIKSVVKNEKLNIVLIEKNSSKEVIQSNKKANSVIDRKYMTFEVIETDDISKISLFDKKYDYYLINDGNVKYTEAFFVELNTLLHWKIVSLIQFTVDIIKNKVKYRIPASKYKGIEDTQLFNKLISRGVLNQLLNQDKKENQLLIESTTAFHSDSLLVSIDINNYSFFQKDLSEALIARNEIQDKEKQIQYDLFVLFQSKLNKALSVETERSFDVKEYVKCIPSEVQQKLLTKVIESNYEIKKLSSKKNQGSKIKKLFRKNTIRKLKYRIKKVIQ